MTGKNTSNRRDHLSVAELLEPYDSNYAAWEMFIRAEQEYDEKHGNAGKEVNDERSRARN